MMRAFLRTYWLSIVLLLLALVLAYWMYLSFVEVRQAWQDLSFHLNNTPVVLAGSQLEMAMPATV